MSYNLLAFLVFGLSVRSQQQVSPSSDVPIAGNPLKDITPNIESPFNGRSLVRTSDIAIPCKSGLDCNGAFLNSTIFCDPLDHLCRCSIGFVAQASKPGKYHCQRIACADCHLYGWRCDAAAAAHSDCICAANTTELKAFSGSSSTISCLPDSPPLKADQLPKCKVDADCPTYQDEHRHHHGVSWCDKGKCKCGVGNFPRVASPKRSKTTQSTWGCDWLWCDPSNETICKAINLECRAIDTKTPNGDFACMCPKGFTADGSFHSCHLDGSSSSSLKSHSKTGPTSSSISSTTLIPLLVIEIAGGCLLLGCLLLIGIIACCCCCGGGKSSESKKRKDKHRKSRQTVVPEKLTIKSTVKAASSILSYESTASNVFSSQINGPKQQPASSCCYSKLVKESTLGGSSAYANSKGTSSSSCSSVSEAKTGGVSKQDSSYSGAPVVKASSSQVSKVVPPQEAKSKDKASNQVAVVPASSVSSTNGRSKLGPLTSSLPGKQSKAKLMVDSAVKADISRSIYTSAISTHR